MTMKKITAGRDMLGGFAPKFAQLNDDVLFGEVWSRESELSARDRSLITVTALMAQGLTDTSFGHHLAMAKENGITRSEIAEILTHAAFYAGWPKAWAAFRMAKDIWADEESADEKQRHQNSMVFPIGAPNDGFAQYFSGQSYLAPVSTEQVKIFNVTFEPGCRNNWHIHEADKGGGQILICVAGRGYYQEWGKEPQKLNTIGKKLGVRIEFVDSVMDGRANGQYIKDKNLIQIAGDSDKPYLFVAAHEITHRMQDLSPAEYREFRKAALEYRMQQDGADTVTNLVQGRMDAAARDGVTLTQDEVMDEIAADFAGDMLDDIDLFERFAKDNRTVAQKLLDSLKEFIAKVKAIFTGEARDKAAQEAYGKDFAELEDIAKQWQAAFDAAERQAEKTKTAAGEGDGARFSLKQTSDGRNYVMVENAMTNAELKNHQAIANYIAQHIGEVYTIIESGQRVYIGDDLPAEYTRSRYTQSIIKSQKSKAKKQSCL